MVRAGVQPRHLRIRGAIVEGAGRVRSADWHIKAIVSRGTDLHNTGSGRRGVDDEAAVFEKTAGTADLDARLDGDLDIEAADLIAELEQRRTQRKQPPGSITVRQYVQKTGCSRSTARRWLDAQTDAGELETKMAAGANGGRERIWWKADDQLVDHAFPVARENDR